MTQPSPSPEQALRIVEVMSAWAARGWTIRTHGSIVWFTDPHYSSGRVLLPAYGASPFDALCQATTSMGMLLEEHPEKKP